ncbi:tripartite motif-containing protein 30A-like [Microtus pennsylvanicus]|uniref:tripartite motif-containing protein 30A-like n=1 Tax=Microtus pennsylvanicus TaxID=10058 RepID=UPI003F6D3528
MTSSVLGMIKEEVTCPICLDLMVEPVNADCGHSFCRACITLNYESSKVKKGEGICPVCQVTYLFGNLRPNWHVANIVERLTGIKTISGEEQKVNVCAKHGEKLQLFCEKDMVAICWLCERSQDHRGHQTALIEEVASKYKGMLKAALERQMANEERCDQWEDDLQKERVSWENQIQRDVENVQKQFKGLREFLDSKETNEVEKLMKEKEDTMNSLAVSQNELKKQRESVRDLISDLEHQLECSTIEMLQGVNSVLTRSQNLRLKQPKMVPSKQRKIFQAPDLKGMLQVFQGLREAQHHWVHVTLRQPNNKNIVINMDKRQIQHRSGYRRTLQVSESYDLGVLGFPALRSGKYYWEVDVSRCDAWLLGINDGRCAQPQLSTVNEKGFRVKYNSDVNQDVNFQPEYTFGYEYKYDLGYTPYPLIPELNYKHNSDVTQVNYPQENVIDLTYTHDFGDRQCVNYQPKHEVKDDSDVNQHVNYQPKYGYWVIGMTDMSVYNAFDECSVTHNASVLLLSLTRPPTRVGVFLDREACTLSFYDVSNHGALIYRFCEPNFPNAVYPYFNPMMCSKPLTVCGPPS